MTTKIGTAARIRRTTVLAPALAVATMAFYSRVGTDEAAGKGETT